MSFLASEIEFLFGARKPIFSGMHRLCFISEALWGNCYFCIYLFIYLIFFMLLSFSFLFKLHHHHHVVRLARISLTLSLHVSLSFIASDRSSGLHPVSSHSCCMYVRASRPAFDWPHAGVHRSTSLTISSLLLQQCPACLVRLTCIVFVIGGR